MSRLLFTTVLAIAAGSPGVCWCQAVSQDSNAQPSLGTQNLSVGSSEANPTLGTNRGVFDDQQNDSQQLSNENRPAPEGAASGSASMEGSAFQDDRDRHGAAPVEAAAPPEDWRMVMHNGRWWYWTPNNSWLYRSGNSWMAYVPRGMRYEGSAAVDRQRYRAGYRGDTRFEGSGGMQADSGLRAGTGQPLGQSQIDPRTGQRTNMSANANAPGLEATRPAAPTADELQGFYRQQGIRATPYGGTMGGARNTTPLGGGATRSGTGATGPATYGTPRTDVPGASPVTGSPGNPAATGSPGNPAGAGGTGAAGTASGAGGAAPTGGAGGASGVGSPGGGGAGAGGAGSGAGGSGSGS